MALRCHIMQCTQPFNLVLLRQVGALCAMNSSLLMPSAFFLILFWAELGPARRAGTATLLALGLALLIMIVAQNVQSLIAQARPQPPGCAPAGGAC